MPNTDAPVPPNTASPSSAQLSPSAAATTAAPAKPGRRWLQYSLRTMLILITLCAVVFAWIRSEKLQREREAEITDWLFNEAMGEFDFAPETPAADAPQRWWWDQLAVDWFGPQLVNVRVTYIPEEDDLSRIGQLSALEDLEAMLSEGSTDLTPLANLSELRRLDLMPCGVVPDDIEYDLRPLANLHKLELLGLHRMHAPDLLPLAQLRTLTQLHLYGTDVEDLAPLRNLTLLKELIITHAPVSDLTPLEDLSNLRMLSLTKTNVTDISTIARFKKLKQLNIHADHDFDLTPLQNLHELEDLDLEGTPITDLSPLAELKNLRRLDLLETAVKDLSPLAEVKNLRWLELQGSKVEDVSPLANLTNLEEVNLAKTPVSQEQVDTLRKALPKCSIFGP